MEMRFIIFIEFLLIFHKILIINISFSAKKIILSGYFYGFKQNEKKKNNKIKFIVKFMREILYRIPK